MSKTISVRVEALNLAESHSSRNHILRIGNRAGHVAADKTDVNSVIISPPSPSLLRDEMAAARKQNGQRGLMANARIFIGGIITFGTEAQAVIENMERAEQDEVLRRVAERISRESKHPLIGLVVHRDEHSVHAHFVLRAFRAAGGKEIPWRYRQDFMSHLQDVAGEELAHLGITRGKPKIDRIRDGEPKAKWVHRSVHKLHDDLPREIEALRAEMREAERKRERNENLALEAEIRGKVVSETYRAREKKAEERLAALTRQIADKERALAAIGGEVPLPPAPKLAPQTGEFVIKSGFMRKETEARRFFSVEQVGEYQKIWLAREKGLMEWAAQKAADAAQKAADAAKKEQKNRTLEDEVLKRRDDLRSAVKNIRYLPNSRDSRIVPFSEHVTKKPLSSLVSFQTQEIRYNVAVQILPGRVVIPSQTPATMAQIAAALYRVTKERFQEEGWKGIIFTVPNEAMAQMLLKMAREDKFERKIEIHGPNGAVFFVPDDEPAPHRQMPQPVRRPEPEAEAPRFLM